MGPGFDGLSDGALTGAGAAFWFEAAADFAVDGASEFVV